MTDRVQSLTVFLEGDFRDDDVQILVDAISLMRGVARVDLGETPHRQRLHGAAASRLRAS
jgi:hypothetical protein